MPITLPQWGVQCRPGSQLISVHSNIGHVEAKIINGGAHFNPKNHYLSEIDTGGLCNFRCTRDNSFYRDGLVLVVLIADIQTPDFKKTILRMLVNGQLGPSDTNWYRFNPADELPRI